jgi:hypothetical protein
MNKYIKKVIIPFLAICAMSAILLNIDINESRLEITSNEVRVESHKINMNDIENITLVEKVNFNERVSGKETLTYANGVFNIEDLQTNVYIHKQDSPFILIKGKKNALLYNDRNSEDTINTYKNLKDYVIEVNVE